MCDLFRKTRRKPRKPIQRIARKRSYNPFKWLWLLALMTAGMVMNMFMALIDGLAAKRHAVSLLAKTVADDDEEHPNIYERGGPCPPRQRKYDEWGYDHRPTLERLLRDLSLPGRLGRMAADALLARITNAETRVWAANRVEDGDYLELRRAKSSSSSESGILSAWDRYARSHAIALLEDEVSPSDLGEILKPGP